MPTRAAPSTPSGEPGGNEPRIQPEEPHARRDEPRAKPPVHRKKPRGERPGAQPDKPLRADAQRNRVRILQAAEEVFAEKGATASTEEVAARAGVAIGTIFRHFPTKDALLAAIMKNLRERLTDEATSLSATGDPTTALFTFFSHIVAQSAATATVVDLLADTGVDVRPDQALQGLSGAVEALLDRAQAADAIRRDVEIGDVMALLAAQCQGALSGRWDEGLQRRTLAIIFDGLRPADQRETAARRKSTTPREAGARTS
jgi:AcrR family transcriptional regulator